LFREAQHGFLQAPEEFLTGQVRQQIRAARKPCFVPFRPILRKGFVEAASIQPSAGKVPRDAK